MAAAGAGRGQARGGHSWLQGLACGALLTFAPAFALLLGVLLAPALVGVLLDRRPGRPVARAVFLAGAAFTLAPAWRLFEGGQSLNAAMDLLQELRVLVPAWFAGASGWAMCEILPMLLRVASDTRAASRIAALKTEAKALRDAWDLETR
jgi:hypothetical protein